MTASAAAAPPSAPPTPAAPQGTFAPLRHRVFAVLWAATVIGNVGSFMRDVASGWLVVDLSASPAAVAAIQAAATLPVFLLAIPAGVLSDVMDRRKLLIGLQAFLALVSLALFALASTGTITVWTLVGLTFLGGVGAAIIGPAWQSVVPEVVPKASLRGAVALNSMGFNIARSIGPAIGGLLLASFGAAVTYAADVATYLVVIVALLWWRRETARDPLAESFGGAFRAGLRFARASPDLHRVLFRAVAFFAFASAAWALLPLIARDLLGGGPGLFGLILGSVGLGAVCGAVVLPRLRERLGQDGVVLASALAIAAGMAAFAFGPPQWGGVAIALFVGAAWIAVLTTLNATTQSILPNWVRGRGLAIYLMAFNGAMTVGSLGWGGLAEVAGVPATLLVAAAGLVATGLVASRWRLPEGEADLTPSNHWPEPLLAEPVDGDRGPVMVTVAYRVRAADRPAFLDLIRRMAAERRRDGAFRWGVMEDAADGERVVEWFMVESWVEHLRQHHRVSKADADIQAELRKLHAGAEPPEVAHLLAIDSPRPGRGAERSEPGRVSPGVVPR